MTLLGGGYVEGVDVAAISDGHAGEEAVATLLHDKGVEGIDTSMIASGANLREDAARAVVERLVERGHALRVTRPEGYVDATAAQELLSAMLAALEKAHRQEPWAMGMTSIALARSIAAAEAAVVRIAQHFVERGGLINRSGYYALVDHMPTLTAEQSAFFDALVPVDEAQLLLPISFAGAAATLKLSRLAGLPKAFDTLLARGAFVKVAGDLYRGTQIDEIRARVERHFRRNERMTAAQFRDAIGTSRKYAVPLLEWMDSHGVTIRDGDFRTLRKNR